MIRSKNMQRWRGMIQAALFAALLCILSPFVIPAGPVPVTLSLFVVFLAGIVLTWRCAGMAVLTYLLLGAIGLPVFAGGNAGFGVILGPSGGYLWSYLPMAVLVSLLGEGRGKAAYGFAALACLLGLLICYAVGTAQFMLVSHTDWLSALVVSLSFLPVDLLKIALAVFAGVRIRSRLQDAGLLS